MKRINVIVGFSALLVGICLAQDKPAGVPPSDRGPERGFDRGSDRGSFRPFMGGGMMGGEFPVMMVMGMAKDLGLTQEQQDQIKDILSSRNEEMKTLHTKMEAAAKAQAESMSQDNPDEAAVFKGVDEIAMLRAEIDKIRIHQELEVKKILTPEQRTKIQEKMKERMEKHGQWDHRNHDGGGEKRDHATKPADAPVQAPSPLPAT